MTPAQHHLLDQVLRQQGVDPTYSARTALKEAIAKQCLAVVFEEAGFPHIVQWLKDRPE